MNACTHTHNHQLRGQNDDENNVSTVQGEVVGGIFSGRRWRSGPVTSELIKSLDYFGTPAAVIEASFLVLHDIVWGWVHREYQRCRAVPQLLFARHRGGGLTGPSRRRSLNHPGAICSMLIPVVSPPIN